MLEVVCNTPPQPIPPPHHFLQLKVITHTRPNVPSPSQPTSGSASNHVKQLPDLPSSGFLDPGKNPGRSHTPHAPAIQSQHPHPPPAHVLPAYRTCQLRVVAENSKAPEGCKAHKPPEVAGVGF